MQQKDDVFSSYHPEFLFGWFKPCTLIGLDMVGSVRFFQGNVWRLLAGQVADTTVQVQRSATLDDIEGELHYVG